MEKSQNDKVSSLTLAITAPSLKLVLEQVFSTTTFTQADVRIFDSYVASRTVPHSEIGPVFEAYLKITGFSALFNRQCVESGLFTWHGTSPDVFPTNGQVFNHWGFIYNKAKEIVSKMDGSPLSVLAHIICFYTEAFDLLFNIPSEPNRPQLKLYTGCYEVYFIFEYVATGLIHASDDFSPSLRDRVVINWCKFCTVPFNGSLLSLSCETFFDRELIHSTNMNAIIFTIITKKSHKLLFDRVNHILRNKQSLRTSISHYLSEYKVKSPTNNSLLALLLLSFQVSDNLEYTEDALLQINDEFITKQFIIKTGQPLRCFFQICHKVDESFMKCIKLCVEFVGDIRNSVLAEMVKSEKFRVQSYEFFTKIIEMLHVRNIDIPVERLLQISRRGKRTCSNQKLAESNKIKTNGAISSLNDALIGLKLSNSKFSTQDTLNWRIELTCRLLYIIERYKLDSSLLPFVKKAISWKHPELSFRLIFKIGNYKIFKKFVSKRGLYSIEGIVVQELSAIDYSPFYFRVCKLVRKFCSPQLLMSRFDSSPFAMAIKHKLDNGSYLDDAKIENGLYFNHGSLKISNLYKKFVLGVKQLLFIDYLNDMPLLRLKHGSTATEICIDAGDLKVNTEISKPFRDSQIQTQVICTLNDILKSGDNIDTEGKNKKLTIEMIITYNKVLHIEINSRVAVIKIQNPTEIEIDENFYGVLKSLVYAETLESGPKFFTSIQEKTFNELMQYTNDFVVPVSRLLSYKSRKGVIVGWRRPLFLGSCGSGKFLKLENYLGVFD